MTSQDTLLRPTQRAPKPTPPSASVEADSVPEVVLKPWSQLRPDNEFRNLSSLPEEDILEEMASACVDPKQNTPFYIVPDPALQRPKTAAQVLQEQTELWVYLLKQMRESVAIHKALAEQTKVDNTEDQGWYQEYREAYAQESRTASEYQSIWKNQDTNILNMRLGKARQLLRTILEVVVNIENELETAKYNKAQRRAMLTTPTGFLDEDAEDLIVFE